MAIDPSAPRKLLIVIASGEIGGGTTHVLQILGGLDRSRWAPHLVCDPQGPLAARGRDTGAPVVELPLMRRRLDLSLVRSLARTIREGAFSLVHAHGSRAALTVAFAARGLGPFIYTEHGLSTNVRRHWFRRTLAGLSEQLIMTRAARVLALSEHARSAMTRLAPSIESKIRVVPNAVPIPAAVDRAALRHRLDIADTDVVVGTIGRLVDQKAPLDLVRAAAAVSTRCPEARFVVIGDGPLRAAAESLARELAAPVRFLGAHQDATALLPALDVFCLSSAWEGLPIALLEAMAAGLPAVSTDVGGIPAVIEDGVNGRLVPAGRPQALAAALETLIKDAALRASLGRAGRAHVEREHSVPALIERLQDIYDEGVPRAPHPAGGTR